MDIVKNSHPYPGFMAKKRLGQNFLIDQNIAQNIIDILKLSSTDLICEIGSGFGALTGRILETNATLIAIEIDTRLCEHLNKQFETYPNFKLIQGDVLNQNFIEISRKTKLRLIGNLPYHITSPLLFKVFDERQGIKDMTVMVQKEVAERIVSSPGSKKWGILSVFSQFYSNVKILFSVSKHVFIPKPKVESSLLQFKFQNEDHWGLRNPELFKSFVKIAFGHRRKKLRNSLKVFLRTFENLPVDKLKFNLNRRPEELSIEQFVELANLLGDSMIELDY